MSAMSAQFSPSSSPMAFVFEAAQAAGKSSKSIANANANASTGIDAASENASDAPVAFDALFAEVLGALVDAEPEIRTPQVQAQVLVPVQVPVQEDPQEILQIKDLVKVGEAEEVEEVEEIAEVEDLSLLVVPEDAIQAARESATETTATTAPTSISTSAPIQVETDTVTEVATSIETGVETEAPISATTSLTSSLTQSSPASPATPATPVTSSYWAGVAGGSVRSGLLTAAMGVKPEQQQIAEMSYELGQELGTQELQESAELLTSEHATLMPSERRAGILLEGAWQIHTQTPSTAEQNSAQLQYLQNLGTQIQTWAGQWLGGLGGLNSSMNQGAAGQQAREDRAAGKTSDSLRNGLDALGQIGGSSVHQVVQAAAAAEKGAFDAHQHSAEQSMRQEDLRFWLHGQNQRAELVLQRQGQEAVRVQVQMRGQQAQVTLRSNEEQTRQLLSAGLEELRQLLQEQGIELEQLQVQAQTQGDSQDESQREGTNGFGFNYEGGNRGGKTGAKYASISVPEALQVGANRAPKASNAKLSMYV